MRCLALLALLLLSACAQPIPLAAPPVPIALPLTQASATPEADLDVAAEVTAAVRRESRPDTEVGVLVVDLREHTALVSANADRPFRSASLSKLLMALEALRGGTVDRASVWRMLSHSDDQVANALWVRLGGSAMITASAQRLRLTGTRPPALPNRWGDVMMTPSDLVRIYDHVLTLPAADRSLVLDALASAPRLAADGFDQHFGIPDGISARWAVKQGWSDSPDDLSLHSTGLVNGRYAVILLTEHPRPIRLRTAADSVTAGARVLNGILT
ncbi:hypothetical protein [Actinokineospora fastidiosa]|uniref:Beta-lactamase class A n=1 Tax=Actinokineospora fastidiosa TaxID=1816 RepID=A0A918LG99_9PSEU|nr:hypothetical protein [Actinokineospora fastidiosa]GGS43169.1 hypothetical protein GCM10010171_42800 [Actinokineospora fastidiosa]